MRSLDARGLRYESEWLGPKVPGRNMSGWARKEGPPRKLRRARGNYGGRPVDNAKHFIFHTAERGAGRRCRVS